MDTVQSIIDTFEPLHLDLIEVLKTCLPFGWADPQVAVFAEDDATAWIVSAFRVLAETENAVARLVLDPIGRELQASLAREESK